MTIADCTSLSPRVKLDVQGNVLVVTLGEPSRLNALDMRAQEALDQVWTAFFADDDIVVAVVIGEGSKAFCTGADMVALHEADDIAIAEPRTENGHFGLTHRLNMPKPIIGAINGLALGGGFEIALCCDILIASENAGFGLPEPMMGGAAMAGGVARLAKRIPLSVAADLCLTCRTMPAAEALQVGLVSRVVPLDVLKPEALGIAQRIAATAPLARKATKAVLNEAQEDQSLSRLLAVGDSQVAEIMASEDLREGLLAFREKRAPLWCGR